MQINIDFHAMLELFNMIRQLTLHKIIEKIQMQDYLEWQIPILFVLFYSFE